MSTRHVDVAIIGAGTAGLNARRGASSAGASVAIIDPGPLGTTCARIGCMPSKLLIAAAEHAHSARHAGDFGVQVASVEVDGVAVMERVRHKRDHFVNKTIKGIQAGAPAGELLDGRARLVGPHTIEVEGHGRVEAKTIVIATGSRPWAPPPYRDLGDRLLTNEQIFELERPPESLLVVGAGAVGLELGQAFHRLGTRVTIVELEDRVANLGDPRVAAKARELFAEELDVHFHHQFHGLELLEDGVELHFTDDSGRERRERFERVLSAAGRRPRTEGLGLDVVGLDPLPPVDPLTGQIGDTHFFMAGDVSGERMLLHEAAHEGQVAGRNAALFPERAPTERMAALGVVFSDPEIALVGLSYQELDPMVHCVGEQDFAYQSRAKVLDKAHGLLRIYAERESGALVGASMVGPGAEHLAHLLAWAVQLRLTPSQALELPFYHPVLEEGVQSALRDLAKKVKRSSPGKACPGLVA